MFVRHVCGLTVCSALHLILANEGALHMFTVCLPDKKFSCLTHTKR